MSLQEFCKRPAVTITPAHTIREACRLMRAYNTGCLLVTKRDGRLSGILTDRDIALRVTGEGRDNSEPSDLAGQPLHAEASRGESPRVVGSHKPVATPTTKGETPMHTTYPETFAHTLQTTHLWLKDLMAELGWDDQHKAYLAFKASLHTLRDRLTLAETAHLGAQLPMLIRGFYYEGWTPAGKPVKERHKEAFVAHIKEYLKQDEAIDPEQIIRAVFKVLARRITAGEIEDIQRILPPELRQLWP